MSDNQLQHIIRQTVAAIPAGKVTTYGDIARRCGYPGYARYVGTTLKQLPANSTLPWYRVIKSDGALAFPVGSAAFIRQQNRLQEEGVRLTGDKVCLKTYGWR